jgi:hypothetical protein
MHACMCVYACLDMDTLIQGHTLSIHKDMYRCPRCPSLVVANPVDEYVCIHACVCVSMCVLIWVLTYTLYTKTYSHFHSDWFFFSKKRKYSGTQRCRKISNRCISVTGPKVEFFFQAEKKTIIMKMRVQTIPYTKTYTHTHTTQIHILYKHTCHTNTHICILGSEISFQTRRTPSENLTYSSIHPNIKIYTKIHTPAY